MRKFGLIGYPLSHSFSPVFFSKKFADSNITDCSYSAYPLTHLSLLPQLLIAIPEMEGINVTIPYKKQVIPFLDVLSEAVKKTGACNCIRIHDGKLYGYNTDVIGIEKSLQPLVKMPDTRAVILGTGGASSAVQYVLKNLGIEFVLVSRTKSENGDVLTYGELRPDIILTHKMIINTTSLGMFPAVDACPEIPYRYLSNQHFLFDLIYNPVKTLFLKKGEDHGAYIKNGAEMLETQAEESWKIWNGLGASNS